MEEDSFDDAENSFNLSPDLYQHAPPIHRCRSPLPSRNARRWQQRVLATIEHWVWSLFMTILTVFALFGDDLRLLATEKDSDDGFYAVSCLCLTLFTAELVLASITKKGYLFGFYFWLDLVSTLSLIADIGWVWNLIIGAEGMSTKTAKSSQVLRAGRASRAGTRVARIIRVIRVIRLIRIVKLYKIAHQTRMDFSKAVSSGKLRRSKVSFRGESTPVIEMSAMHVIDQLVTEEEKISVSYSFEMIKPNQPRNSEELSNSGTAAPYFRDRTQTMELKSALNFSEDEDEEDNIDKSSNKAPEESIVGRKLSDQISKRTILLVLGIMFGLPLFSNNLFLDDESSFLYGLRIIDRFIGQEASDFELAWSSYIEKHIGIGTPIIYLEVAGFRSWKGDIDYLDLRLDEQYIVELSSDSYAAGLNIVRTIFICVILAASSMIFTQDANAMVIGPIESMVERVKRISKNPLEAAQIANKEAFVIRKVTKKGKIKENLMETEMLEKIIEKMGALLAVGFGEAGSEIIIANMRKGGGDVDPMIPGRKVECIFGFCDIRNFTDTTEVLQEDVMQFVNEIANIVHTTAYHFSGAPNKNIGDAFLLVWKFSANINSEIIDLSTLAERHFCRQLADMAVMTFMKIWAQIHRSPHILRYRRHIPLTRRLPNYSVTMGFGLHAGWAIEGAIGSEFKIDASYLSPHVNLASRLEAATKQYGVPILVSGKVYQLVTGLTKEFMRQIDRVTVKGSKSPIDIFCLDISVATIVPDDQKFPWEEHPHEKTGLRLAIMERRNELKRAIIRDRRLITFMYEEDTDFTELLREDLTFFREKFKIGFEKYIKGRWGEANKMFLEAETVLGKQDGPCRTLMAVLADNDYLAPKNWPGYRELTEK